MVPLAKCGSLFFCATIAIEHNIQTRIIYFVWIHLLQGYLGFSFALDTFINNVSCKRCDAVCGLSYVKIMQDVRLLDFVMQGRMTDSHCRSF